MAATYDVASQDMRFQDDAAQEATDTHNVAFVPASLRKMIFREFNKKYGLTLHSSAITYVFQVLQEHALLEDPAVCLESIQHLAQGVVGEAGKNDQGPSIVTRSSLEKVYQQLLLEDSAKAGVRDVDALCSMEDGSMGDGVDQEHYFHAVDAFDMPKVVFDERRKMFERSIKKPSLLAPPQAKPAHLLERLQIVRSVVMRNENFLPPLASGSSRDREAYMKLTSTANLLGRQGQRFLLFGMLCTSSDGRYALEDADGMVGLDLQEAVPGEGIFTEGSMILVEGEYTDEERIRAFAIGHPPSESRETAQLLTNGIDFNGTGSVTTQEAKAMRIHEQSHSSTSFVFISEMHLDDERTLRNFSTMLQGYVDAEFVPFCFVLCGSFVSSQRTASSGGSTANKGIIERYQDAFVALGDLLVKFPSIVKKAHFVFVPSRDDPFSTTTLPRKALPKAISEKFVQRIVRGHGGNQNVALRFHFVSNPCRLVYFGQEITVFRDDLMQSLLAHTVRLKGDDGQEAEEGEGVINLTKFLVSTVLDQAHLCPLPMWARPVLWEFDHTLRLYPMPSVLVLADKFQPYELTYEGCHVFNPSSFREGNFCWTTYYPANGKAEKSVLPR